MALSGEGFLAARRRTRLVGAVASTVALASPLSLPALHSVRVGGPHGARLLVPVLPDSDLRADLRAALGG